MSHEKAQKAQKKIKKDSCGTYAEDYFFFELLCFFGDRIF